MNKCAKLRMNLDSYFGNNIVAFTKNFKSYVLLQSLDIYLKGSVFDFFQSRLKS